MAAYRSEGAANIWFDPTAKAAEIDGLLAEAGYVVRSSDLHQVRSEERRPVLLPHDPQLIQFSDSSSVIHCNNPSDLSGWVDSMLSQISPPPAPPLLPSAGEEERLQNQNHPFQYCQTSTTVQVPAATYQTQTAQMDVDSGIQLVHLLMTCGESVQRGDTSMAVSLIDAMRSILLSNNINTTFGIGKVAGYFIDALTRRLFTCGGSSRSCCDLSSTVESEILYQNFYEACPYLKFAHFTANQAILEAFDGHDCVHVIDFSLMHGLQWPALIQALALRPGGPPFLRITGIGPPSSDGRDSLRGIGLRLADLSRSIGVRFAFRGVAANRLDHVKPWMLHVAAGPAVKEVVAVNSVMQLHRLLSDDDDSTSIDSVLGWIHDLKPKIITLVEQEADHNNTNFMDRFTESLFYYSTMFDSLDAGGGNNEQRGLAEVYLQREICNVLCCEGASRTERHEPLTKWRARMSGAGFKSSHLGSNAYKQASMLLTLFSRDGYCVEEVEGCLMLGWHSRPLISASAWRVGDDGDEPVVASGVGNSNCCTDDNTLLINTNGGSSSSTSSNSGNNHNHNN